MIYIMGEKIKNLSEAEIGNDRVCIELNEGQNNIDSYDIHIETSNFRIVMNDSTYMKFASAILEARKKLMNTKKFKEM